MFCSKVCNLIVVSIHKVLVEKLFTPKTLLAKSAVPILVRQSSFGTLEKVKFVCIGRQSAGGW